MLTGKNIKEVRAMEIRRNYFTEEQRALKLQEEEAKEEYAAMAEGEQAEAERLMKQRWEAICAQFAEEHKHTRRIVDKQKLEFFKEMCEYASSWAEAVTADLYACVTEQLCGQIKFVTDMIILDGETSIKLRVYLIKLIQTADEVSFYNTDNVYVMDFYYKLYK